MALKDAKADEESHAKLVRAGFLRQAHSGVFHMLPLGLRVLDKIEALVDRHMKAIGASRVALSSISSAALWTRSGRLASIQSELFQFEDRKEAQFLLAPTHEEEITTLVAQSVHSYRGLPLRLYQITRKYRDEMRPRHGILRSREFVMKDLYTFDASVEAALATYEQVRAAYAAIFAALKLPVHAARASSGDMGGDLSHEYHLPASLGEDDVASCRACGYAGNTEVVKGAAATDPGPVTHGIRAWRGVSQDRRVLVNAWYPHTLTDAQTGVETALTDDDVDVAAIQAAVPGLDTGRRDAIALGQQLLAAAAKPRLVNLVDWRLRDVSKISKIPPPSWPAVDAAHLAAVDATTVTADAAGSPLRLLRARTGDDCPSCGGAGTLQVERAIELGHTFYLGTRYSAPLGLRVQAEGGVAAGELTPLMGCYGIGISRVLGAVADYGADARGLHWPRAIAPFEVVVVAAGPQAAAAEGVYDALAGSSSASEVLLDDRNVSLPYKLKDADLTGYPVVVVVGAAWRRSVADADDTANPDGLCEVQCRRLNIHEDVPLRNLHAFVESLLTQL